MEFDKCFVRYMSKHKFQEGGNDTCLGIWPLLMDIVLKMEIWRFKKGIPDKSEPYKKARDPQLNHI